MKQTITKKMLAMIAGVTATIAVNTQVQGQSLDQQKDDEPKVSIDAKTEWLSHYMLRGFRLSEVPVTRTGAKIGFYGFKIGGEGIYDTTLQTHNEVAASVEYTKSFPFGITATAGYAKIMHPNSDLKETQEAFTVLELQTLLKPTATIVHDFDQGKGTYAEIGVSHPFSVGPATFNLSGILGYNSQYFRERSGFSHASVGAELQMPLGKNLSIVPSFGFQKALNRDFKDSSYGGLRLELRF